ncbi:Trimethyllysine dioxygenase, mitochondrial [Exaiptasia diaphana]|nr:Trimethyllysine dioxygenase, mitochondrial [Exaiptasia diaphana]
MLSRTIYKTFGAIPRCILRGRSLIRFCGSSPNVEATPLKALVDERSLSVHWEDSHSRFHHVWLRHHCQCPACLNPDTQQTTIDMALIPHDVGPQQVNVNNNQVQIKWNDGHLSCFESSWLKANAYDGSQRKEKSGLGNIANETDMVLWGKDKITSNPPQNFNFDELKNETGNVLPSLLENLYRFGFIFVDGTPLDDESVFKLCELIGGFVLQTVFGRLYVLGNTGLTHADIAYFNPALNGHTGHAYFATPAGLQAMHVTHHDGTGGLSLLVDGFKAAKDLYKEDPEAYEILTNTQLPFEYIGKEHVIHHFRPILEVDPIRKELIQLRYNNTRVGHLVHLSYEEMESIY